MFSNDREYVVDESRSVRQSTSINHQYADKISKMLLRNSSLIIIDIIEQVHIPLSQTTQLNDTTHRFCNVIMRLLTVKYFFLNF